MSQWRFDDLSLRVPADFTGAAQAAAYADPDDLDDQDDQVQTTIISRAVEEPHAKKT